MLLVPCLGMATSSQHSLRVCLTCPDGPCSSLAPPAPPSAQAEEASVLTSLNWEAVAPGRVTARASALGGGARTLTAQHMPSLCDPEQVLTSLNLHFSTCEMGEGERKRECNCLIIIGTQKLVGVVFHFPPAGPEVSAFYKGVVHSVRMCHSP